MSYCSKLGNVLPWTVTFLLAALAAALPIRLSQGRSQRILIPIGGGYAETNGPLMATALERAMAQGSSRVEIAVLPIGLATRADQINEDERAKAMQEAEARRNEIERSCLQVAAGSMSCKAVLVPVLTRSDAQKPMHLAGLSPDLAAIYILGGDQKVAMQVIDDTPVEEWLGTAYQRGVMIAGTSAGAAIQSWTMLAGYKSNRTPREALQFGAIDVWGSKTKHGLIFGLQAAILDTHFFLNNRLPRLINAIALPDVPHIGIGIDAFTGVHILDGHLVQGVFGKYGVTILDAETYKSAQGVQYRGARNLLSLRNILIHRLSPGEYSYDLYSRQHSLGAPLASLSRQYESLRLPTGAGPLWLGGGLSSPVLGDPMLLRFANLCGGQRANILILAAGYPFAGDALRASTIYAKALGVTHQIVLVPAGTQLPLVLPGDITGILFIGADQSLLDPAMLAEVKSAWLKGIPLFMDGAPAAVAGVYYSVHGPTPEQAPGRELATQGSFLLGNSQISPGLALVDLTIEPRVISDAGWGRVFSLAYQHSEKINLAIDTNNIIEISTSGARVTGSGTAVILDLRSARLGLGTNGGFVIANGLMDIFVAGEEIQPIDADINWAPIHAPTPVLPSFTPLPSPTQLSATTPTLTAPALEEIWIDQSTPTKSPRPTPTPLTLPPPADPGRTNMMIGFGVLSVIVVILGIWLNRRRITE